MSTPTPGSLEMRYGLTADDVKGLNAFPIIAAGKLDPVKVESFLDMRAGMLNTMLASKGVDVPVGGPLYLVEMIRMAVLYGACAMVEITPVGQDPTLATSSTDVYEARYQQVFDYLNSLTETGLLKMGVAVNGYQPVDAYRSKGFGGGFDKAGSELADGSGPWWWYPPLSRDTYIPDFHDPSKG